jgi:hypothetical protein
MSAEIVELTEPQQATHTASSASIGRDENFDLSRLKAFAKKNNIRISIHGNDDDVSTPKAQETQDFPEPQRPDEPSAVATEQEQQPKKEKKSRKPSAWSGFQKQAAQQIREEGGKPTLTATNARARELAEAAGHVFKTKKKPSAI